MNNDQNFKKRNEIKLGYAIATAMDAIAPRFLNPCGILLQHDILPLQLL
ncbi:hypothetical protein [Nostoc sp.]